MRCKDEKNNRNYPWIYGIIDFIVIAGITVIAFFTSGAMDGADYKLYIGMVLYTVTSALLTILLFLLFGVYGIVPKSFGVFDYVRMVMIALAVQFLGLVPLQYVHETFLVMGTVGTRILASLLLCCVLPLSRFAIVGFRIALNILFRKDKIRTLVIGAGGSAKIFYDECIKNKDVHNKIIVCVDDDPNKIGGNFSGIPVKGPISEVGKIIDYHDIEEVIIAISDLSHERLQEILGYLEPCMVRVRRMPLLTEMSGPNDTRIIDIDVTELLDRKQIKLDNSGIRNMLNKKVVMVTGAGGSIGSELVRQIFDAKPKKLILFDIYENSTYDIQQDLTRKIRNEHIEDIELITLIGSTYNEQRVEQIIKKYRPDYIYHAAAYKHVPLMEDSPMEAIRTNVIGTYNVAKMADKYGVKKMLLVSTDKAVRPTNVMGATKRFAETIIQYFASISKHTSYCAVRFGNVLGSNGSVIPLFKKQIGEGGPVTVTDKRINRFFMTIPEAVGLILQSSLFANGGEIFILDMGKPVKIVNLAERMIRQAGFIPYYDIEIKFTGLRPGEKLYEEILLDVSEHKKTSNSKIYIEEKQAIYPIDKEIVEIQKVFDMEDNEEIRNELKSIIRSYVAPEEFNK